MPQKSRRVKKTKKGTKRFKGGISESTFYTVYPIVQALSRKLIYFESVNSNIQSTNDKLMERNQDPTTPIERIELSIPDWCELIAASFKEEIYFVFDDSEIGVELAQLFDYTNPDSFSSYVGNVSDFPLNSLFHFVKETSKHTVFITDLIDAIETEKEEMTITIDLTESDWCELIAESFEDGIYFNFEDSEIGEHLSTLFDYTNPKTFSKYRGNIVVKPHRRSTVTQSYQGTQPTCFAHSATLLIFHNMYKLPFDEEDKKIYLKNNCNLHLDTTKELEDYNILKLRCGKNGAARLLLFLYIYRVITANFGCSYGLLEPSILYYLKTPFQPSIFGDTLNKILRPIYETVSCESFVLSSMDMDHFTSDEHHLSYLDDYLKDYYAGLTVTDPRHIITIVGLNKFGVLAKNSGSGSFALIPYENFKKGGSLKTSKATLNGIESIIFLYEKRKIVLSYPESFAGMLYATTYA